MKRLTLLATLAVAGLLTACDDDNDTPIPGPKTNTELLMAKSWTLTALTLKEGSDPEIDIFAITAPCSKDDKFKFQDGGVFVFDESTNVCSGEAQTITGIWGLEENDQKLTLSAINRSTSTLVEISGGKIDELTTNKLMVTESFTEDGVTTVARYTFSGN